MSRHALFIGTSPLMQMQALVHAEDGGRVTIVDRADHVGGSWATPPLVGLDHVECGVHLLENRPRFYTALRQLGIVLEREETNLTLWRSHRLRMAPARVLFHTLVALNAARRGQLDRSARVASSALRSLCNLGTGFEYPAAGCRALHARLTEKLARHGISPMLGVHVDRIEVVAEGVRCDSTAGLLKADCVVLGSRAHAPLSIDSEPVVVSLEHDRIVSLVLRGRDSERCLGGYVELLRDPHLKRIRDVTRYCVPALPDGEFVLCVQLRASGETMLMEEGANAVATYIGHLGFLSPAARLTDFATQAYAFQTITDASLRELEGKGRGRIRTLRTTDFADGFRPARRDKNT